ncbi:hypothetical protein HDU97_009231 [Phlyctochytrium planicorne]|nr:hypothetical protein HDU97_009231 [Phlyctochytrium planicorne]
MVDMMPTPETFALAKNLTMAVAEDYLSYLHYRISEEEDAREDVENLQSKIKCRFFVFIQQTPLLKWFSDSQKDYPDDVSIPIPKFSANALIFSPECDVILKVERMRTLLLESYYRKASVYTVLVWIVSWIELLVTAKQMQYTATQSARTKVSVVTIGMQTVIDAYMCMLHFAAAGTIQHMFLPFITASFFKFTLFSVFEMRYVLEISRAQRRDSDETVIGIMYSRTYLFVAVFFFYQFGSNSPMFIGSAGNVKRNSKRAFLPEYIFGISVSRIVIPLYIYGCPYNVVNFGETSYVSVLILSFWMILQVFIIYVQDRWGPRSFVPEILYPKRHDYHAPIEPSDIASTRKKADASILKSSLPETIPKDSENLHEDDADGDGRECDCAICFSSVFPDGFPATPTPAIRLSYMFTPCRHIFHSTCLEKWMEVKFECPICRFELPPP